jgi:hypothetical protein
MALPFRRRSQPLNCQTFQSLPALELRLHIPFLQPTPQEVAAQMTVDHSPYLPLVRFDSTQFTFILILKPD